MRTLRISVPLVLSAVALGGPPSASATTVCASADALPLVASTAKLENAAACLVNQERTRRGLPALRQNRQLAKAASGHSRDMVSRDYFSHDTEGGGDFAARIRRAGYRGYTLGEDLAWGSGTLGTARAIVRAWMKSPGHRANILSRRYREMGVGVALGTPGESGPGGATYAVDFGRR
jgi:uncharacterized protein YkwD